MNNLELTRQYQKIKSLIDNTHISTQGDVELQGHWGKYLCILVSGFLENAISAIYIDFVTNCSAPHVAQFTTRTLEKIQNPKTSKFVEIASSFKKEWGNDLEAFLSQDESRKNAIDSIMQNRHQIAHGKNTSISVQRVRDYFSKCIDVIEFIEKQCSNKA